MAKDVISIAEYKVKKCEVSPVVLPIPSANDPYAEIKYIFEWVGSLYDKKSSKSNYSETGLRHYLRYVEETNDYKDADDVSVFSVKERWDEFCLVRFKAWFDDNNLKGSEDYISSSNVPTVISAIRNTIRYAKHEGIAANKEFIDVSVGSGGRETEAYEAFSDEEYKAIVEAVKKATRVSQGYAKGYIMTGRGIDPRTVRNGWYVEDNMRWYFENEMNAIPVSNDKAMKAKKLHQSFFKSASYFHGGLNNLYNRWGVTRLISGNVLAPLLIRLAIETGLNSESILSLTRDCFIEKHPLTGMPSLRYWKTRGEGDQELHLVALGDPGVDDIQLKLKQARVVQKTISLILELTESLVEKVDDSLKNDLFLFESDSTAHFGVVKSLKECGTLYRTWLRRFSKQYMVETENSEKVSINLARFRPTLFTKLVNMGVDIFIIKDIAFHSSVTTTLRYLTAHNINKKAREEISSALENVYQSAKSDEATLPYATKENVGQEKPVKYKGLVCDCKNVFDPPAKARKLKEYTEGSPCKFFNMCLECENILVTKSNLPSLASYRLSLLSTLESQFHSPNAEKMMKYLMILDAIFDVETSEFEKEDIEWAMEMAQFDNEIYDSQVATGVA